LIVRGYGKTSALLLVGCIRASWSLSGSLERRDIIDEGLAAFHRGLLQFCFCHTRKIIKRPCVGDDSSRRRGLAT